MAEYMNQVKNKALFLDRDGIINVDTGYAHRREEIIFIPGIFELCRHAKEAGYYIIIITNQAGIGRGYYTEQDFNNLMQWMREQFAEQGIHIDDVFYCPHHSEHGLGAYKKTCHARKPQPGMLMKAIEKYTIHPDCSIMLGDKHSDMQAALAARIATRILVSDSTRSEAATAHSPTLTDALKIVHPLFQAK